MIKRKFRPSKHQRRMERFARTPRVRPRWPRMETDYFWNAEQQRAEEQIFLYRKWYYDKGEITAYAVNMRLAGRRMNKTRPKAKEDRHGSK